jgi:hypothetical protein
VDHSTSHGVGVQNGRQLALGGTLNQWTYLDFPGDSPSKRKTSGSFVLQPQRLDGHFRNNSKRS